MKILLGVIFACVAASPVMAKIVAVKDKQGRSMGVANSGELLVQFAAAAAGVARAQSISKGQGTVLRTLARGWTLVTLPAGMTVEEGMAYYEKQAGVAAVAPNTLYQTSVVPNDTSLSQQYALSSINAFAGWEYEIGDSTTVIVAIIDTGVLATHVDLDAKVDVTLSAEVPGAVTIGAVSDDCGHGSNVAGIVGAETNNGEGIAGVSWGAKIVAINVFPASCTDATNAQIMSAVDYAVSVATNSGLRMVINMSLGTVATTCDAGITSSIRAALDQNISVVAAAGNQGSGNPNKVIECPAKVDGVIAVGATTSNNTVASFSAQGAELDVIAPGQAVLTTSFDGNYTNATGTSFSAPHVAGLISLMYASDPTLSTTTVISYLRATATDLGAAGFDTATGYGLVDAYRVLRLVENGTLADFEGDKKAIAFPNPFKRSQHGTVNFALPAAIQGDNLSIRIYTSSGEQVRILQGRLSWDGKNEQGAKVSAGVYIYRVKTDDGTGSGRIIVQ